MKLEHETLAVRALDAEGHERLAGKLDNNGFMELTTLEKRTTIHAMKSWKRYIHGDIEAAIEDAQGDV